MTDQTQPEWTHAAIQAAEPNLPPCAPIHGVRMDPADVVSPAPADATLRDRIADAIRDALKTRTLPAITDVLGRPIPGSAIGLTEHDLADVVLAVIQPELDRLDDQPSTCDASEVIDIGFFGRPHAFGPCTLRQGHAGPVHKAANGAQWWAADQFEAA